MWTTDAALAKLRARMRWPASGGALDDAALLDIMDDVLQTEVFPMVLKAKEDYRVYHVDYPIQADVAEYRLPPRAHAGRLKDVQLIGDQGRPLSLPLIALEQAAMSGSQFVSDSDRGRAFYFRDDWVGLWPVPKTTRGTLRLYYYMRPGKLVLESVARQITLLDGPTPVPPLSPTTTAWLADFAPENDEWNSITSFDVVGATGGYPTLLADVPVYSVQIGEDASGVVVEGDEIPPTLSVGDWICNPGESPIPQIPDAAHTLLILRSAVVSLAAVGDTKNAGIQQSLADAAERKLIGLLKDRVDGEPKIVSPDSSPLRQVGSYRRRWR